MPDDKVPDKIRRISNAPMLAADQTEMKKLWVKLDMKGEHGA